MIAPAPADDVGKIIIGIIQPNFLPWLGYFEQIAYTDHFVLLDDVQYTKQDWRNRNRIKTTTGPLWLTVPVRRCSHRTPICDMTVTYATDWVGRHLKTIRQSYGRCRFFEPLFSELAAVLELRCTSLVELDLRLVRLLCRHLQIDTPLSLSSQLPDLSPELDRNQRLIEICRLFNADRFYEGRSGAAYLDLERFRRQGITVVFQDYRHPEYRQAHGGFIPSLSAVDLIMNTGAEAGSILRSSPVSEKLRRQPR